MATTYSTNELLDAVIWDTNLGSHDDNGITVRIDPVVLLMASGEPRIAIAQELARRLATVLSQESRHPGNYDIRHAARVAADIARLIGQASAE